MKKIELKAKVGSVSDYNFFYVLLLDHTVGTFKHVTLQISGFKSHPKDRIEDQHGNDMDFEVFLSSLKIVSNEAIFGPNKELIAGVGGELAFRLIPTTRNHDNYIHSDGTLLLEVDLRVPSKVNTIDGYTGASKDIKITDDFFVVSYEAHVSKKKPMSKEELEDSIVCPVCKSNNIRDTSIKENNGGWVGSYEEWKVSDTRACLKCGVMFIPVVGNGLQTE
jgi:hypothetical protein|tara:strand:- start:3207 stop:3869 length:663 start_codon:yes stop_codon:yes gene_type:complete